jgi:hypothetical protein
MFVTSRSDSRLGCPYVSIQKQETIMPIRPDIPRCTHLKLGGHRCGSPAMTGEQFCYFHMQVKTATAEHTDPAISSIMLLEDAESVQGALMQIVDLTLKDQIAIPKARLILRAVELAWKNLKEMQAQRAYDEEKAYHDEEREQWAKQDAASEQMLREERQRQDAKSQAERAVWMKEHGYHDPEPAADQNKAAETAGQPVEDIQAVAEEAKSAALNTAHTNRALNKAAMRSAVTRTRPPAPHSVTSTNHAGGAFNNASCVTLFELSIVPRRGLPAANSRQKSPQMIRRARSSIGRATDS